MSWSWTLRDFYFRRTRCCSTIADIPLKRCKVRDLMSDISGTFIRTISKEHGANDATAWQVECRLRLKSACAAKMGGIAGFCFATTRCSMNKAESRGGSRRLLISKTASKLNRGCAMKTSRCVKRLIVLRCTKKSWDRQEHYAGCFRKSTRWPQPIQQC